MLCMEYYDKSLLLLIGKLFNISMFVTILTVGSFNNVWNIGIDFAHFFY